MSEQKRIEQLERELAEVREQLAQRDAIITHLQQQIADLQGRLGKDSHNSHKPPSSDGFKRRPPAPRTGEAKRRGSPIGHRGETLHLKEHPDQIERHRPSTCTNCGALLEGEAGQLVERRQVVELPEIRVAVIEHRQERVWCPQCQQPTTGTFPDEVSSRIQYGPRLQALGVYLRMQHLVPVERTSEVLHALTGEAIAGATILAWEHAAAQAVAPAIEEVREALRHAEVMHGDETSLRIGTILHWVHVHSTRLLTLLQWHRKRGRPAMDELGVLPLFSGTLVHDRWESYWPYPCRHALCHAHLLRDLQGIWETTQQSWAKTMHDGFLDMLAATGQWRIQGGIPPDEPPEWEAAFWQWLDQGERLNPARPGRKQTAAHNLARALRDHAPEVLAFLYDLSVPFTNNQAEQDLRMLKVQQKIAGCCRSDTGATALCRLRSAISCLRKQGRDVLSALAILCSGHPISLLPVSA